MINPPRPETAIDPSELIRFENMGWWGQLKLNGTCTVAESGPKGEIYTRHRDYHKNWSPEGSKAIELIRKLPSGTTFIGELLHNKVHGGHKDTLYLFDVTTFKNEDLFGERLEDRYKILSNLWIPNDGINPFWLEITPNLWIVKNLVKDFEKIFESLTDPEHEGLVLKNPKAKLQSCSRLGMNSSWQVKCRRPHKNYSF